MNGGRDPFGDPAGRDASQVVVLPGETHSLSNRPAAVGEVVGGWLDELARLASGRSPPLGSMARLISMARRGTHDWGRSRPGSIANGDQRCAHPDPPTTMMVLLDYWIPCHLVWLSSRRSRARNANDAEACRRVAARSQVSTQDLLKAQDFASKSWFKVFALSVVLFVLQALAGLFFPKGSDRDLVLNVALSWVFLALISVAQATMVAWRGGWTGRHVLRTVRGMFVPPSLLRWGRPRLRDFWLMLIIAMGGAAGILYGVLSHPTVR